MAQGSPQCPGRVSGGPGSQQDPHRVQTLLPPPRQARKNPNSSSSGVWLPLGTGRSPRHRALPRFGYLLRGCFRTAWTGREDNGAAPAPSPALSGLRKIPIFLPQELLGWRGWGYSHSSSDTLPSWEGAAEPPWVPPGREQDPASGAPARNWLVSTWKKYCCFLNVEARKHLSVSCLSSLLQGALSAGCPFQPNPFFTHFLSPGLLQC